MRSLLFIPADDEKKLGKGLAAGADALILDLEDAVSPARKAAARTLAAQYIAETRGAEGRPRLYVRINALDTHHWEADIAGIEAALPDGILLPKARSGEDVHTLSIALNHAEEKASTPTGSTRIIALVTETPISLLQLHTYVGSSTRLDGVTWGAEDLSAVLGARTNREDDGRTWTSPYQLARNLCLFTAAAAGVQPIDTVFVNFRDDDGLRQECRAAVRDGFTGKMAIHPNQIAVMNEAFTPKAEEVALSEEIVKLFADHPDAGALAHRGQMVDRAHVARAERILARAKAAARRA
ncbi:MAG: CoA ester lyase [Hyphomonadaceae bacterium]|jgi:citrate lyase subunit beta/citryl-CoA lyase|nr:CoA ester lyase [Hyphomonadaceae bacterium]